MNWYNFMWICQRCAYFILYTHTQTETHTHTHTHTHILNLIPFEDRKLTGIKVDTAAYFGFMSNQLDMRNRTYCPNCPNLVLNDFLMSEERNQKREIREEWVVQCKCTRSRKPKLNTTECGHQMNGWPLSRLCARPEIFPETNSVQTTKLKSP